MPTAHVLRYGNSGYCLRTTLFPTFSARLGTLMDASLSNDQVSSLVTTV